MSHKSIGIKDMIGNIILPIIGVFLLNFIFEFSVMWHHFTTTWAIIFGILMAILEFGIGFVMFAWKCNSRKQWGIRIGVAFFAALLLSFVSLEVDISFLPAKLAGFLKSTGVIDTLTEPVRHDWNVGFFSGLAALLGLELIDHKRKKQLPISENSTDHS